MTATAETKQKELDLVFVCDCTGSMGSYLAAAQKNITQIVQDIVVAEKVDVRFALVQYRDHPPEESTFAVRSSPFTSSADQMKSYVSEMEASGGGDGPESVVDGMNAALEMPWRENAAKVCCLIADAPPHGLAPSGDGFPKGCPCEKDPIQVAAAMAKRGIVTYTIGAEPGLSSSSPLSLDFMRFVAKKTSGLFLPLGSAELLAKVIVGAAVEQIQLRAVLEEIADEVRELKKEKGEKFTREDAKEHLTKRLQERKVTTTQVQIDDIYDGKLQDLNAVWFQYSTITQIRDKLLPTIPRESGALQSIDPSFTSEPVVDRHPTAGHSGAWSRFTSMFSRKKEAGAPPSPPPAAAAAAGAPDSFADFSYSAAPPSAASIAHQTASLSSGTISGEQVSRMYEQGEHMGLY